jgi:hypothetical protein
MAGCISTFSFPKKGLGSQRQQRKPLDVVGITLFGAVRLSLALPRQREKRGLYGLHEMESEVLRAIVAKTERGQNLDAALISRAKAILDRYTAR